jgi:hypothetical protein
LPATDYVIRVVVVGVKAVGRQGRLGGGPLHVLRRQDNCRYLSVVQKQHVCICTAYDFYPVKMHG